MYPKKTLVGVHVRRSDLLDKINVDLGYRVAPASYFLRAFYYISIKHGPAVFVVLLEVELIDGRRRQYQQTVTLVEQKEDFYSKFAGGYFAVPIYLNKAAKTAEILGDYNSALAMYKRIKSDFPDSQEAADADKNIAYAETKLSYQ